MTQPEARLQQRIVKALIKRGVSAWRIRPMGIDGWPDLYILVQGIPCHQEIKLPGEVPEIMIRFLPDSTKHRRGKKPKRHERLQVRRLDELAAAGAVVGVSTSVEESVQILVNAEGYLAR